jgi:MFS transporter, FSR family, fosmidomycin resistance protein
LAEAGIDLAGLAMATTLGTRLVGRKGRRRLRRVSEPWDSRAKGSVMTIPVSSRLALGFSCVGHTFSHLLMLLYPTVVLSLEGAWDMSFGDLIALMLGGQILFGVAAVPAGWLADRWSVPGMMAVFFIGTGGLCVATGFADDPVSLAIGLGGIGLFASIYHPVGIAWVTRDPATRGRALGINGVFGALGTAGGAAVAGTLASLHGWQWAFFVPGAVCVLVGVGLVVAIALGMVRDARDTARAASKEASRGDMVRGAMVLMVTIALSGLIYQSTSFAMPKLFDQRLVGLVDTTAGVGLLVSLVYGVSAIAQVGGGWLADRYDLKRVYIICWAMQIPFLAFAATLAGPLLLPVAAMMVLTNTAFVPAENSLFARFSPPAWRGTAFGVKFLVSLGVSAVSVPLVGQLYDIAGDFEPLLLLLTICAAGGAAAGLLLPSVRRADPVVQPAE